MSEDTERLTRVYVDKFSREELAVVGSLGAVQVWREFDKTRSKYYGGVEVHMRHGAGEPDQSYCSLLGGPCWHDGSTMAFEERRWNAEWKYTDEYPDNYESLFAQLVAEYEKQFITQPKDEQCHDQGSTC